MFNMLNKRTEKGKNSPMVCKFISGMSAFPDGLVLLLQGPGYLLERMGFRNHAFPPVGLRIAFPMCQPAFARIRGGKD